MAPFRWIPFPGTGASFASDAESVVLPADDYCPAGKQEIWRNGAYGAIRFEEPTLIWTVKGRAQRIFPDESSRGAAKRLSKGAVDPASPPITYSLRSDGKLLWGSQVFEPACE